MPGKSALPSMSAVCAAMKVASALLEAWSASVRPCDASTANNTTRCDVKRRRPERLMSRLYTSPVTCGAALAVLPASADAPLLCAIRDSQDVLHGSAHHACERRPCGAGTARSVPRAPIRRCPHERAPVHGPGRGPAPDRRRRARHAGLARQPRCRDGPASRGFQRAVVQLPPTSSFGPLRTFDALLACDGSARARTAVACRYSNARRQTTVAARTRAAALARVGGEPEQRRGAGAVGGAPAPLTGEKSLWARPVQGREPEASQPPRAASSAGGRGAQRLAGAEVVRQGRCPRPCRASLRMQAACRRSATGREPKPP